MAEKAKVWHSVAHESPEDTLRGHSARVVGHQSDTSVKMLRFMDPKRKSHVLLALLLHDLATTNKDCRASALYPFT
jgi:hypothetical protein